jgi:PKD repeat protein
MHRLLLALLGLTALFAFSGCERLCNQVTMRGVFCPETEDNKLNDPPFVDGEITFAPRAGFSGCAPLVRTGTRIVFGVTGASDPDGDPLQYEWDLDGDGDYEAGGEAPSAVYTAQSVVQVRVRVSDYAYNLGAPGAVEKSLRLNVVDPARNQPPVAALTASAPAVVGDAVVFDAGASSDPDPYDVGGLAYGWEFGDGTYNPGESRIETGRRTVTHVYDTPGERTVKLQVGDCAGGSDTQELRLVVRPRSESDRAPTARFTAAPESPYTGQGVLIDGSASTDPNGQIVSYEWDFDGDLRFERTGRMQEMAFATAGEKVIRLRVTDDEGLVNIGAGSVTVRRNLPPTASFTYSPVDPFKDFPVTFDARGSSDREGPVARYEWDLDGNGSFETDGGGEPQLTHAYTTPGMRLVRLRVTDFLGVTAVVGHSVNVRIQSVTARASQAAPPPLAFSARLSGSPVRGGRGTAHRRGARRSVAGVLGRGTMRARVLGGGRTAAERSLTRFLRAGWRTRVGFGIDRRTQRWNASALALARAGRAQVCLRVRLEDRPGHHATGRLTLLGGRGAGARLRGTGTVRFALERDGSATVLGHVAVRTGKPRPLPRACRALAS